MQKSDLNKPGKHNKLQKEASSLFVFYMYEYRTTVCDVQGY